ncbi:MAG: hypothetical protein JWQ96_3170 [Segetibacter sp.]|nr:hypothetical protein [Segetibacter sp.]
MAKWWVGCSGFHYKHWRGSFYPQDLAVKKWFDHYQKHFKTLELNTTFYRFPKLSSLENWYATSPDDFVFAVKVPKGITHYKQFINLGSYLEDFYAIAAEGLKDKLGCVLFQLPPRTRYKEEKLDRILEHIDPNFNNVLEFRHETWWNAEVYNTLARHNITFCGMSHPQLPEDVIQNTPVAYFRFHGVPDLYRSKYELSVLTKIADEIQENPITRKAFIYFNNDIDASAIGNALEMEKYVAGY